MREIFFHTGIIDDNMRTAKSKVKYVVGIDEVGRGPLAGPVCVCVATMKTEDYDKLRAFGEFEDLHNSKALSEKKRNLWNEKIIQWKKEGLIGFAYISMTAKEIDDKGISVCIKECLDKGLEELNLPVDPSEVRVLLDGGLHAHEKYTDQETIIKGDETESIISLASIIAKVRRDNFMIELSEKYPDYGLEKHKGYGTVVHRAAIKEKGTTEIHRVSFCRNIV
jgi:ribonuclease HII